MKRGAGLLPLAAALGAWLACPGGVLVNPGNNFPCDFSQPEGVRDQACAPGDVCGVDNLCRAFHYEGPQFEASANGAPMPAFDAVERLHPGLLDQPVLALTHRGAQQGAVDQGVMLMGGGASGVAMVAAVTLGPDTTVALVPYPFDPSALLGLAQPSDWVATVAGAPLSLMNETDVVRAPDGTVELLAVHQSPAMMPLRDGERLRSGSRKAALLRGDDLTSAGEFGPDGDYVALDVSSGFVTPDGGGLSMGGELDGGTFHPLEVRFLPLAVGDLQDLLMLGDDGFFLRHLAGRLERVSDVGVAMPPLSHLQRPTLRHDVSGAIWAFTRTSTLDFEQHALSTWRLDAHLAATIQRLWNDCSPCGKNGRIVAFTPVLDGAPEVQVLCGTKQPLQTDETFTLTRVVGSAAIDESEDCLLEPAQAPFALSQLNFVPARFAPPALERTELVQDDANGGGILLGGKLGQVWAGDSLTDALPLFLERTPVAFGTFQRPDGGVTPVALTDRYMALPRVPGLGFEVVDIHKVADVPLAQDVVLAAMMGQAPGWGVLSSGDLALLAPPDGGAKFTLSFGPRLVDGRGQPALSPFLAEGAQDLTPQRNLVSFVLTANDSLYFTPVPPMVTDTTGVLPDVMPQLTPAPGSPIRSMTLERSAIGTDGVNKVRGYLVAGRQLFLFTLGGSPPRWSATPIVLQGGAPIEVWMDNPLGGLGRVGYLDGEVFTLPGGFLLVNQLPKGDGGMAPQVLDYENLGGWPVAMTTNGLYCAQWEKVGVNLQNRFPDGGEGRAMDWQEVSLPDGGRPWLGKNARLQVVRDTLADAGHVFELYVFTDDEVLQVGTLERK